jgi:hypothetical protein
VSSRKIKAISEHRTKDEANSALEDYRQTLIREGMQARFSLKVESTGDMFIPWAVFLYTAK